MKAKELRLLSDSELQDKLKELKKQQMELEFKRRSGAEKPHLFKLTKKDIARILTILNERIKTKK
ncbi:MAG: 50S ribosomal protein L29 [Candidatus Omnitrophica bacterium]|nr:50S ribosomal protein L29 [Candidatus Omnitrophota bacterium]